jgi:hypothetical protein
VLHRDEAATVRLRAPGNVVDHGGVSGLKPRQERTMNLAHDDDGIIDLRALKSTRPPPTSFASASPFGSEPPPAAFAMDADGAVAGGVPARASKAKTIAIAAGAGVFLILGAVGVVFAFRGEKPAVIARAPTTLTTQAAAPAAAAPPAPVAASQPAASDDVSAADAPTTKKTKGAKARAGVGAAKTKASFSATSSPKPAVTKTADPCHCHGDFQCNIRCSAAR